MNAQVRVNHFVGSILIAQGGEVFVSKEYGVAVVGQNSQNNRETRRRLGSITEQFTAMAVMQLQEKRKLQVQDSVCRHLPDCPAGWQEAKIFNLLTHTSGIPNLVNFPEDENTEKIPATGRELLSRLEKEPLEFKPGERLKHSYAGYEVLAAVIENVSDEPYAMYLKKHIFDPLAMSETGYDGSLRILPDPRHNVGLNIPLITPSDLLIALPYRAGGLYSNIEDLYRWDHALLTEKLVSRKSLEEMLMPYKDGQGFGWAIQKEFNRKLIIQGGGINVFSASTRYYLDDDACTIVLSNSENADAGRIGHDLAAILFGKQYESPTERQAIKLDPTKYDHFVGSYVLDPSFMIAVTKEGDRLMVQGSAQGKIEIFPESETRFFSNGLDARINFVKNASGRVTQLILQQGGSDLQALKVE